MLENFRVYKAFTNEKFKGNPAGIVFLDETIEVEKMQKIAKELGYPETVFIFLKDRKNIRVRFFTPKEEINLCGHATIAYSTALVEEGIWKLKEGENYFYPETNLGKLPILIEKCNDEIKIMMYQAKPSVQELEIENIEQKILKALRIKDEDLNRNIKIVKAYTGVWDIMIPIKNREVLNRIIPDFECIKEISQKTETISFHLFAIEESKIYARNLAPIVDIYEEAATGTSNGALGYYLYKLGLLKNNAELKIIQGESLGRKSVILVKIKDEIDRLDVLVGGKAVNFIKGQIFY